MENKEIATILSRIADILEIEGKDSFRIRAYRQAALHIAETPQRLQDLYHQSGDGLDHLPGIGKSIKRKIIEIIETGGLKQYEYLKKEISPEKAELLNIESLGPKKVKRLIDDLGIQDIASLEKACREGRVAELEGMGEKSQVKILTEIAHYRQTENRMQLRDAAQFADSLAAYLRKDANFKKVVLAGSFRRGRETVGDLDILAVAKDPEKAAETFTQYPEADRILQKGASRSSVVLKSGLQVDLRIVAAAAFGAALVYFTGSKDHNIKIRTLAKKKEWKISEYGIFSASNRRIAGRTEKEIYRKVGMDWVAPELREDRGEIEAALEGELPKRLVEIKDIKGDLHSHTQATDGKNSVVEMLQAAKEYGYEYLAITDHTKATRVAGGLEEKEYAAHIHHIRRESRKVPGIRALCGAEVDILEDGSLDLSNSFLNELDIVLVSIHSGFGMKEDQMTSRILKALDNPYVNIFTHPTGRRIGRRKPYEVDLERVFKCARQNNVFLEINANPSRMDLKDIHVKFAKETGVRFAVNTDAHSTGQFENMRYGVMTARRGWVEKKDVLNARGLKDFLKTLKK